MQFARSLRLKVCYKFPTCLALGHDLSEIDLCVCVLRRFHAFHMPGIFISQPASTLAIFRHEHVLQQPATCRQSTLDSRHICQVVKRRELPLPKWLSPCSNSCCCCCLTTVASCQSTLLLLSLCLLLRNTNADVLINVIIFAFAFEFAVPSVQGESSYRCLSCCLCLSCCHCLSYCHCLSCCLRRLCIIFAFTQSANSLKALCIH